MSAETSLTDWILALSAIPATWILRTSSRAFLLRWASRQQSTAMAHLAGSTANLIIIAGFRWFVDFAPLSDKVALWAESGVYVVTIFLVLNLARHAAMLSVEWVTLRGNQSSTVQQGFVPLLRNIITIFIFVTGAIMVLKHFNYDVMSLIAALGVGSLAVGLAAQPTLSNMISGFTLIIDRNLRPGDRVSLAGMIGDVEEIGLRSTRIRLGEGSLLIVPNAELVNTKLVNQSLPNREIFLTSQIRVPLNVDFEKVKSLCDETIRFVPEVNLNQPITVRLASLADGQQLIQLGFWARDFDQSPATLSAVHQGLLKKLTAAEIPLISPPQLLRG